MSRAIQGAVRILTSLLLFASTPQLLRAQPVAYFDPIELTMLPQTSSFGVTTLSSSAKVILKSTATNQQLASQVILGHNVVDITAQNTIIFTQRVVSETGEASEQAFMSGIVYHCY